MFDKILEITLAYMIFVGVILSTIGVAIVAYIAYLLISGTMPLCW